MDKTLIPDDADLAEDGDTVELTDGRILRMSIQPDQDHSIMDEAGPGVWCGLLEWDTPDRYGCYPYGQRPEGFDGLARVIERDHGRRLWWQPPGEDIIGPTPWDAETMREEETRIRELVEYGYNGVTVELCSGRDAYGHLIVRDMASLWGVEWNADREYLREVCNDLIEELSDTPPDRSICGECSSVDPVHQSWCSRDVK